MKKLILALLVFGLVGCFDEDDTPLYIVAEHAVGGDTYGSSLFTTFEDCMAFKAHMAKTQPSIGINWWERYHCRMASPDEIELVGDIRDQWGSS